MPSKGRGFRARLTQGGGVCLSRYKERMSLAKEQSMLNSLWENLNKAAKRAKVAFEQKYKVYYYHTMYNNVSYKV